MNAQYMFRGKRLDNAKWVTGKIVTNKMKTIIISEQLYDNLPFMCGLFGGMISDLATALANV